ncbi:hypothetical protein PIB30_056882 [Stylosanthes scabra]|uniref:Uncharacterized protein n=1 Tax=Stylosanthes scabra TaxID=79078 RepID=A0ABU6VJC0_9FABA|nr:hypothetical protein [Stylosanthes scabra]
MRYANGNNGRTLNETDSIRCKVHHCSVTPFLLTNPAVNLTISLDSSTTILSVLKIKGFRTGRESGRGVSVMIWQHAQHLGTRTGQHLALGSKTLAQHLGQHLALGSKTAPTPRHQANA